MVDIADYVPRFFLNFPQHGDLLSNDEKSQVVLSEDNSAKELVTGFVLDGYLWTMILSFEDTSMNFDAAISDVRFKAVLCPPGKKRKHSALWIEYLSENCDVVASLFPGIFYVEGLTLVQVKPERVEESGPVSLRGGILVWKVPKAEPRYQR
eukprot:TRINITY_DN5653_c0_g1_i1.p1 TRINITY_DN5653_c0_g1~~TRINITY_DN5653_c0_g1_i1.p1  ORF type:complete len:152 (+),score=28.44 TRINITY_DN5653_c0_g1_i1:41-496(+)